MTDNRIVPLPELLREIEPSETVGSEDSGVFACLFEGSMMETVTLALDDTNQTLEDEEMQSLASSDAGLILYQEESDDWSIEYFEDTEELADRWGEWQDEARSAYGQLMGFDEEEI